MALFNRIHDFLGVKTSKLKGSLRSTAQKMKAEKERLQNSDKVKRMKIKSVKLN